MGDSVSKLKTALANPGMFLELVLAIVRGRLFRLKLSLFGPRNVKIGKGLRIYTKLYIRGPGTVIIGERFSCNRNIFITAIENAAGGTYHRFGIDLIGESKARCKIVIVWVLKGTTIAKSRSISSTK